jgi:hypothetical protein
MTDQQISETVTNYVNATKYMKEMFPSLTGITDDGKSVQIHEVQDLPKNGSQPKVRMINPLFPFPFEISVVINGVKFYTVLPALPVETQEKY